MKINNKLSKSILSLIAASTACPSLIAGTVGVGDYDLISNSSNLIQVRSNHSTSNILMIEDSSGKDLGSLEAHSDGASFGLKDADGDWTILSTLNTDIDFFVNASQKMTIQSSGNVGIGTAGPAQKLHVSGNMRTDGRNVYFGANQKIYGDDSASFLFDSDHDTATIIRLRDKQHTTYGYLYGETNGALFGLRDADNHWSMFSSKDDYTQFRINNIPRMTIKSDDAVSVTTRVGIGTTGPTYNLQVVGDGYFSTGLRVGSGISDTAGSIRYSGGDFQGYNGSTWVSLVDTDTGITSEVDGSVTNETISTVSVNSSTGNLEIAEAGATKTVALADIVENAAIQPQGDVQMGEFTSL